MDSIIDNLPGMVFRCSNDKDLSFEYVSKGSLDLLGYEPSDLVGSTAFRKLVHPEDQPNNKDILKRISLTHPRYEMVYRMRTARGEDKWVKEEGLAIFSRSGDLVAIEGMLTDITAQKLAEIQLRHENSLLRDTFKDRYRLCNLIGRSPVMQRMYDVVIKAAANKDATVIITGESGTGKELAARAIHDLGERKNHPFVPVNCGAIPENLMESEFFGHIKGAFSGASADKKGYLDIADGGTLFLDEIGEISPSLQVKLLRALDGKGYMPVGSSTLRYSDFRLVAATNKDLQQLVRNNNMRMDFYYRINVIPIRMPALRERKEDILLLTEHFLEKLNNGAEKTILPYEFVAKMKNHKWPGNVRELKNVIDRYKTLGEFDFIDKNSVAIHTDVRQGNNHDTPLADVSVSLDTALNSYEQNLILKTLEKCRWKKGKAATELGISWRTLQRKMKKYAIE